MATELECNNCGAHLDVTPGQAIVACEYCGAPHQIGGGSTSAVVGGETSDEIREHAGSKRKTGKPRRVSMGPVDASGQKIGGRSQGAASGGAGGKRWIIVLVILALLGGGGYFAYRQFLQRDAAADRDFDDEARGGMWKKRWKKKRWKKKRWKQWKKRWREQMQLDEY